MECFKVDALTSDTACSGLGLFAILPNELRLEILHYVAEEYFPLAPNAKRPTLEEAHELARERRMNKPDARGDILREYRQRVKLLDALGATSKYFYMLIREQYKIVWNVIAPYHLVDEDAWEPIEFTYRGDSPLRRFRNSTEEGWTKKDSEKFLLDDKLSDYKFNCHALDIGYFFLDPVFLQCESCFSNYPVSLWRVLAVRSLLWPTVKNQKQLEAFHDAHRYPSTVCYHDMPSLYKAFDWRGFIEQERCQLPGMLRKREEKWKEKAFRDWIHGLPPLTKPLKRRQKKEEPKQ